MFRSIFPSYKRHHGRVEKEGLLGIMPQNVESLRVRYAQNVWTSAQGRRGGDGWSSGCARKPTRRTRVELEGTSVAHDHHYTVSEFAKRWHLSPNTVHRLVADEPGVIKITVGPVGARNRP